MKFSKETLDKAAEARVWVNYKEFCKQNAEDLRVLTETGVVDQLSFEVEDVPKPYEVVLLWEWL